MGLESTLGRIRSIDLVGVLLPGLVVVGSFSFNWAAWHARSDAALWQLLDRHLHSEPKWYPALLVLILSYLAGSVIRSLPVSVVDNWTGQLGRACISLFARVTSAQGASEQKPSRVRLLYAAEFPYCPMLESFREELVKSGSLDGSRPIPSARGGDYYHHAAFDYWKTFVAQGSPALTLRLQEHEGRARMFYGLFWATSFCVAASTFAFCHVCLLVTTWVLGVSVASFVVFALQLRHVRGQEARQVYCAFVVLCQLKPHDGESVGGVDAEDKGGVDAEDKGGD